MDFVIARPRRARIARYSFAQRNPLFLQRNRLGHDLLERI